MNLNKTTTNGTYIHGPSYLTQIESCFQLNLKHRLDDKMGSHHDFLELTIPNLKKKLKLLKRNNPFLILIYKKKRRKKLNQQNVQLHCEHNYALEKKL